MSKFGGVQRILAAFAIYVIAASGLPAAAVAGGGPSVTPPSSAFELLGQLTSAGIPLKVTWPAGAPNGAPIARYQLQKSIDQGPWSQVALAKPLNRSVIVRARPWTLIQFRLRAVDTANVASEWAEGAAQWLSFAQEAESPMVFSAGWQLVQDSAAYGGRRAVTRKPSETATFSFLGRQVAWVARLGPDRGTATVSSDLGTTTVHLRRSNASSRRIVFRATWPSNATHDFSIATSGADKAVDIDAFLMLSDPPEGQLVGAGDISTCTNDHDAETAALVTAVLDNNAAATAFTLGDNVYSTGTAANFANCYDPTWGAFKARTRPTPGNHDYQNNPGAGPYYAYFGANAGPAGRGWYRYDAGTWRVYSLNSECAPTSACAAEQLAWLKSDLANQPHRCVLAMWHRPRVSTGPHGTSMRMNAAFTALYDAGADVVVAGHDHGYQRFAPANPSRVADSTRGIREFVAGTGGAELYEWKTENSLLETRGNVSFGVLRLDLHPGSYSWEFIAVPGPTGYTDSGTTACH